MRLYKALLFWGVILNTVFANAATLNTPFHIELLALNGQEQKDKSTLDSLKVGNHQMVIRYIETLKSGSKYELFSSPPYVLELSVENDGDEFNFTHRNFNTYSKAVSAFDRDSIGWEMTKNGTPINLEIEKFKVEGFMPLLNIENSVREYNKKKGIILTSFGVMDATDAILAIDNETGDIEISGDAITQLKLWYAKASKEELKEFKRWMIDQE